MSPERPDWMDTALCARIDPELFYPDDGVHLTAARRICMQCSHRVACLEYALANDEVEGTWGAKSPRERRVLHRRRRRAA